MTPEQDALRSKACDSVRAAKLLSEAGLYDFAVSCAYYAMFYVADETFLRWPQPSHESHTEWPLGVYFQPQAAKDFNFS